MVAGNDDFHLKSIDGRWDPATESWTEIWADTETSRCVASGNPESYYLNEPTPNGGRINMGAYGNTPQASKVNLGSIAVTIEPAAAATAGAQWELWFAYNGDYYYYDGLFHDSGDFIDNLKPGVYIVNFIDFGDGWKGGSGFRPPDYSLLTLNPGEDAEITGVYSHVEYVWHLSQEAEDGTWSLPWHSISKAYIYTSNGETIYVKSPGGSGLLPENWSSSYERITDNFGIVFAF